MFRRAGLAAVFLLLLTAASASAATKSVSISGFAYHVTPLKVGRNTTVTWTNNDSGTQHSATSDVAGLFDTGFLNPGQHGSGFFTQAGGFSYHCRVHSFMHGVVKVKMSASPSSGATGTTFTLTLASATVPSGFTHDIQVSRNGGSFMSLPSTTNRTTTFRPTKSGTYKIQTRLHQSSTSTTTDWSPSATITVG